MTHVIIVLPTPNVRDSVIYGMENELRLMPVKDGKLKPSKVMFFFRLFTLLFKIDSISFHSLNL